ncbi:Growth hormone receptor [Labeo rohita]|uniref:Growth hormone receptor n=1 Tax=Labeo rohita TaxID=84645 RepID=A0ABQ8N1B7_LABRO|nr:Growth hormone receptor [Labeo rohita]
MEIFTCWWRPIANQDNVTYTLLYTTGERAPQECPDYVTGGINSCFFDVKHTQVWEVYCMNVTAHTRTGPVASHKHCVDVADIVEIDPPFNLTYIMLNESVGESGRSVLLSWSYPVESQVREGWITLIYELRYRHFAQPDNWKMKERLREPHVELLDLPVGKYEFMVRCRSANSKHWSAWSESINITINGRPLSDRMLALILVTSIAIMAFLVVGLGIAPRGKRSVTSWSSSLWSQYRHTVDVNHTGGSVDLRHRVTIKSFLLPPIPKPRIRGIEPVLLKKGKIDEINRHFSSFHGYKPPQYSMETWYQVSVDACPAATPSSLPAQYKHEDAPIAQHVARPEVQPPVQTSCSPAPYCLGPASYCGGATPPPDPGPAHPELMSVPGMDYSMILNPVPAQPPPPPQDFYTCVNGVMPGGALHLVPCLPDALKNTPYLQFKDEADDGADKSSQLSALLEKQMEALLSSGESDPSDAAVPLLPLSSDTN